MIIVGDAQCVVQYNDGYRTHHKQPPLNNVKRLIRPYEEDNTVYCVISFTRDVFLFLFIRDNHCIGGKGQRMSYRVIQIGYTLGQYY